MYKWLHYSGQQEQVIYLPDHNGTCTFHFIELHLTYKKHMFVTEFPSSLLPYPSPL